MQRRVIALTVILNTLLSRCACSVDFTHSTLYDIYDCIGQDVIQIQQCDNGCVIYASTMGSGFLESPTGYDPYADNLIIYDNIRNQTYSSIAELSSKYDEGTSQKTPLIIMGPASVSIRNVNLPTDTPWPIVLYVVRKSKEAELELSYDVYDAINMRDLTLHPNKITTVMSAYPFSLEARKSELPNGVIARLVGFDNAFDTNGDECPVVFSTRTQDQFSGFNLRIDGPLISLIFDERNAVKIDAMIDFPNVFDLSDSQDGFIASGGYNGCWKPYSGGMQSFRSMLLHQSFNYYLDSRTAKYRVTIHVDPYLDDYQDVTVTDITNCLDEEEIYYYTPFSLTFEKTDLIQIGYFNLSSDQGFLMRYTAEVMPTIDSTTFKETPTVIDWQQAMMYL